MEATPHRISTESRVMLGLEVRVLRAGAWQSGTQPEGPCGLLPTTGACTSVSSHGHLGSLCGRTDGW